MKSLRRVHGNGMKELQKLFNMDSFVLFLSGQHHAAVITSCHNKETFWRYGNEQSNNHFIYADVC